MTNALTPYSYELLADLETPLGIYLKLANGPYSYLLESVQGDEKWGRYSFIGLPCTTVITVHGKTIKILENDVCTQQIEHEQPLVWLKNFQKQFKTNPLAVNLPFYGGLVGYFGYDLVRTIEPILAHSQPTKDVLEVPDAIWLVSKEVVIFDKLAGKMWLVILEHSEHQANQRSQTLEKKLNQALPIDPTFCQPFTTDPLSELLKVFTQQFPEKNYQNSIGTIKNYIRDGETMQVVLSQRLTAPYTDSPVSLYRALRCLNPSPYHFYLNLKEFHLIGASPEILVRKAGDQVTVRPIAGTRKRGKTPEQDLALTEELLADPKELAEHIMLIDLGRNDLGRVCVPGSVKVTEKMVIERYSHVMHLVSHVTGQLKPGLTALDAFQATFPAGTVTGAPKIRAMQIIDELEPSRRGVYAGAIGYLSWHDNMDTAIAIRTAIVKNGTIYLQAGAGIVADSIPKSEWQESLNKAYALMQAVAIVCS